MNKNKIYKLLIIITTIVLTLTMYSSCYADNEKITNDFELNSYSSSNNEIIYGTYIEKNGENILLSIKAADYNLPSNLYNYKDDIHLRITYTEGDYKVYDCKIINHKNGEVIEDLSEENINKLFNIEYGKNITEKSWSDKIKLSDLNENAIYKYTANSTTQFPKIENDIGKNCIIYIKEKDEKTYEKKINMYKEISGSGISISFNEYKSGETFCLMYKSLKNSELLDLIEKDKIIYLSKYKDGDKLEYQFEEYIYNDTDKNITINTKNTVSEVENSNSVVIEKGEIYGFDWQINSAIISYLADNNSGGQKTEEKNNNDGNNQIEQVKENTNNTKNIKSNVDNTVSSSKLPQTGISSLILIVTLSSIIIMIVIGTKLKKFKDIE